MDKRNALIQLIQGQGVLPLYFHKDTGASIKILKALHKAGIQAIEYMNRGELALENFKHLRKVCDEELEGMYLGIGTIKNKEAADIFITAGADFIVCPGLVESVVQAADEKGVFWIPGCMTPSEIIKAESLGAKVIKLFPASLLGPFFVRTIRPLFPKLLFMPTGTVDGTREDLERWFNSGVYAVGMGSKLIGKNFIEQNDYESITEKTRQVLQLISSIQKTNIPVLSDQVVAITNKSL